jgi:hypothetical protein
MGEVTNFSPTELQTFAGCSANLTINHILRTARNKVTITNKELTIEIRRIWNLKAKLILVIIGATGTISKSLRQYLSNTPGKHEIIEIIKKRPYWAPYNTTESANVEVQNIFHGQNNITCSTTCKKKNTCNTIYPRNIVSGI